MQLESQSYARPRIVSPKGTTIAWDDADQLWLLRAVEVEGAPRDLVAQTLVNRFAWLYDAGKYVRLADLVRAYAQPVNPLWFPEGRLFQQQYEAAPESAREVLMRRAVLRRDINSTRTAFSPNTVTAVRRALYGPLTLPAGALHFAAPSLQREDLPVLVPSVDGSNVIYGESKGLGSRARYSLSTPAEMSSSKGAVMTVVALLAFGLGALLWSRPLK